MGLLYLYAADAGKLRNTYEILAGNREAQAEVYTRKSIKIYLKEIWWEFLEWVHLVQNINQ